tara:strand:+ start:294 stop:1154 length:861 start_codon:yes stop_codon:yes gene_type:complete
MKKKIQWDTKSKKIDTLTPSKNYEKKESTFRDEVHAEGYGNIRQKFDTGVTWMRFLPAIVGSQNTWMMKIELYEIGKAVWKKPAFGKDLVYACKKWFRDNDPGKLWDKETQTGYRLWEKPTGLAWAIDATQTEGSRLKLLRASLYSGSGSQGLGSKIHTLSEQRDDEPGSPTLGQLTYGDITDPAAGRLVKVDKSAPKKGEYPTYSVSIGSQSSELTAALESLTDEEHNKLCPLEDTTKELTIDEQATYLRKYLGEDFPEAEYNFMKGIKTKALPDPEEEDKIPGL